MSKRVLLISEYFYPHWTGIAYSFYRIAKQLTEHGFDVKVLTVKFSEDLSNEEELENFKVSRVSYSFFISRTQYSIQIILRSFIEILNSHYIVVNSPFSNILFISIFAKILRKRLIIFHQGDLILSRRSSPNWKCLIIEKLFDIFTKISFFLADRISTYTEDYCKHSRVMNTFQNKFIPYIPPLHWQCEKTTRLSAKIAQLKKEHLLIGFAGRFVEEKGFDILLKSIPLVISQLPNTHFIFAGETNIHYEKFFELNYSLLNNAKDNLTILGLLKGDALKEFYSNLSAFVLPSRSDCFAITQVEAALLGIPLVASDIPGARVLVRETQCGILCKPEDSSALANAIVEILQNPDKYKNKSEIVRSFLSQYETPPIN